MACQLEKNPMSIESVAEVSSVNWTLVASFIGTMIATGIATFLGLTRGKKKVEAGNSEITPIVGGTIMESATMARLTTALEIHSEEIRQNTIELQHHTEALYQNTLEMVRRK